MICEALTNPFLVIQQLGLARSHSLPARSDTAMNLYPMELGDPPHRCGCTIDDRRTGTAACSALAGWPTMKTLPEQERKRAPTARVTTSPGEEHPSQVPGHRTPSSSGCPRRRAAAMTGDDGAFGDASYGDNRLTLDPSRGSETRTPHMLSSLEDSLLAALVHGDFSSPSARPQHALLPRLHHIPIVEPLLAFVFLRCHDFAIVPGGSPPEI